MLILRMSDLSLKGNLSEIYLGCTLFIVNCRQNSLRQQFMQIKMGVTSADVVTLITLQL